jgi:hypothetical protein
MAPTENVRLLCSFSYHFSLSVPSAYSFSRSLSLPTELWLRSRLSTKCIRLFCNLYLRFSLLVPYSACSLFFSLSLPAVAVSISLFYFRLYGGLKAAGFRRNTFGFSAPSPFPSLRRSHRSLPTVSHSLPTEWRLWSVLSKEYIWFLCYLYFSFSLWVSFACSFSLSLSLPTE